MESIVRSQCFICDSVEASPCQCCGCVSSCETHIGIHRSNEQCAPFTIGHSDTMGHYMLATRDIKQMELILREEPVMVGPYSRPDQPHCVECFKIIREPVTGCAKCGYPLCPDTCTHGQQHSTECQVFSDQGWRYTGAVTDLAAISVIRLLAMKTTSPDTYARLMRLEDHNDRRREEEQDTWSYHGQHVVAFIRDKLHMDVCEQEIWSVLGKMLTNSGDLELSSEHARGCGYYPTYANMNHACRANTKTFKYPNQVLEVRAQVAIAEGAELSTQYLQSMKATFVRRPILRSKWFFDCQCTRCLDPSECGSFLSAILCNEGSPRKCGGIVLSADPTQGDSDWVCQDCDHSFSCENVLEIIKEASNDAEHALESDKDCVEHYERVLCKYSAILHPHHTVLVDIKMKLAQILGNFAPYQLMTMSIPLKERKIQLCQELLEVISKVDPGFTKTRGIMLSEMNKTKLILSKQNLLSKPDAANDPRFKKQWEKACLEKQFLNMYLAYYQNMFHNKTKA